MLLGLRVPPFYQDTEVSEIDKANKSSNCCSGIPNLLDNEDKCSTFSLSHYLVPSSTEHILGAQAYCINPTPSLSLCTLAEQAVNIVKGNSYICV